GPGVRRGRLDGALRRRRHRHRGGPGHLRGRPPLEPGPAPHAHPGPVASRGLPPEARRGAPGHVPARLRRAHVQPPGAAREAVGDNGRVIPPDETALPFNPLRQSLYSSAELFAGFEPGDAGSYAACPDARVLAYFRKYGTNPVGSAGASTLE